MRAPIIGMLLCACASAAAAQTNELRVGPYLYSARRLVLAEGASSVTQATNGLFGAELLWRGVGGGIFVRVLSGSFGPQLPDLVQLDARLVIGPRPFSVEIGYGQRAPAFSFATDSGATNGGIRYGRLGARSALVLGTSGFQASLDAGVYVSTVDALSGIQISGFDAETMIQYQAPRGIPVYGIAGYRFERTKQNGIGYPPAEELSGLIIGVGFRFASKLVATP